jgi:acetyltransferase-like isoleucine patch superfamily enzyme
MNNMSVKSLVDSIRLLTAKLSSDRMISYLRKKGISIGGDCIIRSPNSLRIDLTRPSLVTIGNNVDINKNFQIMTHDFASGVFRVVYGDFLNSSGKVTIGNNIYFGTDVIVLKGVTIGDNCIIGAGSIVNRDIPSNSVATGTPCRVVCSLQEYYNKRKQKCVGEAFEYAKSIQERFNRKPVVEDFWEEFPLFVDVDNINDYPMLPIKKQLDKGYNNWLKTHKKMFNGFEEFLKAAQI